MNRHHWSRPATCAAVFAVAGLLGGCSHSGQPTTANPTNLASSSPVASPSPTSSAVPTPAQTPDGFNVATAAVPALCGNPAGTLVDGTLPTRHDGGSTVSISVLADGDLAVATGDIDGSGENSTAIAFTCTANGVAQPPIIVLYDAHGKPGAATASVTPGMDGDKPLKSIGIGANVVRYEASFENPGGTHSYHPVSVTYSGGAFSIADVQ